MSEFSDSCHLRATESQQAVDLLRAAKVPGYVFGPSAGWVPFVFPLGSQLGLQDFVGRVVAANTGVLLNYSYAGDHGCSAVLYQGAARVAEIRVSFESKKRGHFDRAKFVELGLLTAEDAAHVERWVADPRRDPELLEVAARLRLPRHELFAYEYERRTAVTTDHRIEVGVDGTVHCAEDLAGCAQEPPGDGGPLFALTQALVQELVRSRRLVLVSGNEASELAEDLVATIGELEGRDAAEAIVQLLTCHELVEEHFADAASIRATLLRLRAAGD